MEKLAEALLGLEQRFMNMEELTKAGEEGKLIIKSGPFGYDSEFQQMYPDHPMSEKRYERIEAADAIRNLARERKNPFPAEVLNKLHISLFDCCAAVRLSIAEALTVAGDKSSIAYLERLEQEEKDSPMVMEQVKTALEQLRESYDLYTKERVVCDTISALQGDIGSLYQAPFINWRGKTKDDNQQLFTEVIAEEFLKSDILIVLQALPVISRERYDVDSHDGSYDRITNREEEILSKDLFNYCNNGNQFRTIGAIFDYQVPLKKVRADKAGKIDLVSFNAKTNKVWLLELKKKDNKETLLRCMMEISTYYQLLDKQKFIASYSILNGLQPDSIGKAVLVFKDSTQHQEIIEMSEGKRPMLKSLSASLDISFFLLEDLHFTVEEIKL
ncbi:MAG: hypothetical protein PHY90_06130 [Desulfitobacteriaceae bacterium]|nr:hypothetical protein [Desulfitobacteriaceae bacterium]